MALDVQSAVDGKTARIALRGKLDASAAPALRETVDKVLSGQPAQLVLRSRSCRSWLPPGCASSFSPSTSSLNLKIYLVKPRPTIVDTLRKTGFYDGVYVTGNEPAGA